MSQPLWVQGGVYWILYCVTFTVLPTRQAVQVCGGLLCDSAAVFLLFVEKFEGFSVYFCPGLLTLCTVMQQLWPLRNHGVFGVSQKHCPHLYDSLFPLSMGVHVFLFCSFFSFAGCSAPTLSSGASVIKTMPSKQPLHLLQVFTVNEKQAIQHIKPLFH